MSAIDRLFSGIDSVLRNIAAPTPRPSRPNPAAAVAEGQLSPGERPHFQEHLAHILLPLQEKDGSWWDYPLYAYHQPYGTSMAVMTLLRCRPIDLD